MAYHPLFGGMIIQTAILIIPPILVMDDVLVNTTVSTTQRIVDEMEVTVFGGMLIQNFMLVMHPILVMECVLNLVNTLG